ncbi:phospholipase A2 [Cryptosporangium aurantiacum]|uniref:Phospholipase A2 n=1 Tax=Cryptosporangium aurantiacum TaxID=134849 RepID=A0A1M7QBP7_9ACTN|nr:phospholipase A2 [Cryptosporangium aurantiacum]
MLVFVLLAGVLGGDAAGALPDQRRDTAAGVAVRELTAHDRLALPGDFVAVMGYRPVRADGAWGTPRGACSAPTGPTRYDFTTACRTHDLGYDLLRYAARVGQPLGPWARAAIDAAFGRAMDARCAALRGAVGCPLAAAAYHAAVVTNSWRQDWREPRPEPVLRWVLIASGLTLAPVVLNAFIAARARRRVCEW